jgi:hypothetical protein
LQIVHQARDSFLDGKRLSSGIGLPYRLARSPLEKKRSPSPRPKKFPSAIPDLPTTASALQKYQLIRVAKLPRQALLLRDQVAARVRG